MKPASFMPIQHLTKPILRISMLSLKFGVLFLCTSQNLMWRTLFFFHHLDSVLVVLPLYSLNDNICAFGAWLSSGPISCFLLHLYWLCSLYAIVHMFIFPSHIFMPGQCLPHFWWNQSWVEGGAYSLCEWRPKSDLWLCIHNTSFCICFDICKLFLDWQGFLVFSLSLILQLVGYLWGFWMLFCMSSSFSHVNTYFMGGFRSWVRIFCC